MTAAFVDRADVGTFIERYAERLLAGPADRDFGAPINPLRYDVETASAIKTTLYAVAQAIRTGVDQPESDWPPSAFLPPFQTRVADWMQSCFGEAISADKVERNHRFLEEALELVQSHGCTASEAHQLVDYTFGRPIGDPVQEVGGVMVTLAALCSAAGINTDRAAEAELTRVWLMIDTIRAKQAAKPKHSPLPEHGA